MDNKKKGSYGENLAKEFLLNKGYTILETNYYTKSGEIDIIAKDDNIIVFVEVKYRKSAKRGLPLESINEKKQSKIIKTAYHYILENEIKDSMRFDAIGILNKEITHIINAFGV